MGRNRRMTLVGDDSGRGTYPEPPGNLAESGTPAESVAGGGTT